MDWEIKRRLTIDELEKEIKKLKNVLYDRKFIHSNGSIYRVNGVSIICKNKKAWYSVNYHPIGNSNVTFTRDLNEFLDGRFTEI